MQGSQTSVSLSSRLESKKKHSNTGRPNASVDLIMVFRRKLRYAIRYGDTERRNKVAHPRGTLQGYLAHVKQRPTGTLQQDYV
jgi:hypothetical protein